MTIELILLCGFAFIAGFIDAIVGGGGLIQLPALLIIMPTAPIVTMIGTNKLSSICGTGVALWQYTRKIAINWRIILPTALAAFIFSFLGARTVSVIKPDGLRPIIIVLLVLVAIYTFIRKDFGGLAISQEHIQHRRWLAVLAGAVIGFYDGFLGPGTGSFLIFSFIIILGLDFLSASASAKAVNFATNLSALIYFGATGQINYLIALPMAVFNILGSVVGSRLAMLKGSKFVRILFLVVVWGVIAKLGYDAFLK